MRIGFGLLLVAWFVGSNGFVGLTAVGTQRRQSQRLEAETRHSDGILRDEPTRRDCLSLATSAAVFAAIIGRAEVSGAVEETAAAVAVPAASETPAAAATSSLPNVNVPYKGKEVSLSKFKGKAMLVVNVKNDDPEALKQYPALNYLNQKYAADGLRILAFPTDQGWYEPEVAEIVRLRALQSYSFGQFPYAVVFDKVDVVGPTQHPLFNYLASKANPNGRRSITLNFEKFLLDDSGAIVRRYPRKYSGYQMEKDVAALLRGDPLPPESEAFLAAWEAAAREAIKSEYAFRSNYNVYNQDRPLTDWKGTEEEGFR